MNFEIATLANLDSWDVDFDASRVVFERHGLRRLGALARELGAERVLIVTDPGVRQAGHVDRAVRSLEEASIEVRVFDSVGENPNTAHVNAGTEFARQHRIDCIVGLGGGSAMDCSKGVNFLLTQGGRMEDYWGFGKADQPMLPSIGVPTTAGTGSEAQSYALISREGVHVKMACGDRKAKFRTVILDPKLTATVPRSVAAVSGMDAVSHAVESYVSKRRNPISQPFAKEAWRLLDGSFANMLRSPDDEVARGRMLIGSHLAGAAIEHSMLGAAHACANPLTERFDITHGIAVGLMLPPTIRFNTEKVGELYRELHRGTRSSARGATLLERVCGLRTLAGLPERLRDCSIPRKCLPELATEAGRQWTAGFNPRPLANKELLDLYEAAY